MLVAVLLLVLFPLGGCKTVIRAMLPKPPPFPCFTDRNVVIAEAARLSDALEDHIRNWLDGKTNPEIPSHLLPDGMIFSEFRNFCLVSPDEIRPEEQWMVREAKPVDFNALYGYFPDPHCTYIILPTLYAPFGSKVIVEGEFPRCRFFSIQITPPFHPEAYRNGYIGVGEVPIVDADIEPEPGSINPFRVGADRTATNRRYRVEFTLAIGNPVELEPAFKPPAYRAPGNHRYGGALVYRGPWRYGQTQGQGKGFWDHGCLWIRYYLPDNGCGPLAGVSLPKVYYQLPDGRRYFVKADFSAHAARMNRTEPAAATKPVDPPPHILEVGWDKMFGIFRSIMSGIARATALFDADYVRRIDLGAAGRGEDVPPPGNYENSATCCNYINYLTRGMSLGSGKVVVLTGKLPTTPRTRNGEARMTAAQARYWSLTAYSQAWPKKDGFCGAALYSICDEDILTDAQRRYVIVFSRPEDRPINAYPSNGVTWVNWGPVARVSWTIRWMSVMPEWSFEKTPHETNLTWATDWASRCYDRSLLGRNTTNGWLGQYQPIVHYLRRETFEALGTNVTPERIPRRD